MSENAARTDIPAAEVEHLIENGWSWVSEITDGTDFWQRRNLFANTRFGWTESDKTARRRKYVWSVSQSMVLNI